MWTWTYDGLAQASEHANAVAIDPQGRIAVVGDRVVLPPSSSTNAIWVRLVDADRRETIWTRTEEAAFEGSDYGLGVAVDAAGNVIAVGMVYGGSESAGDAWVQKIDPNGAEVWTLTFDGAGHGQDWAGDVVVDADGNVVVAGKMTQPGDDTDLWVAKITPEGEVLWDLTRDSGTSDSARGVTLAPSGDILVVGKADSWEDELGSEAWVAEFTTDGEEVWDLTLGRESPFADAVGNDVAVDGAGNLYVAGEVRGDDGVDWGAQAWLTELDPEGAQIWERLVRSDRPDESLNGVVVDDEGNVVVVGTVGGGLGLGSDLFIAMLDGEGEEVWAYTADGVGRGASGSAVAIGEWGDFLAAGSVDSDIIESDGWVRTYTPWGSGGTVELIYDELARGPDHARGVAFDAGGHILVVGDTAAGPDDGIDVWLGRLAPNGGELWTRHWDSGSPGVDKARAVAAAPDGGFFVAGEVGGGYGTGGTDAWLRRFDSQGDEVWTVTRQGPSDSSWDSVLSVAVDARGGAVVAGVLDDYYEPDAWVAAYDAEGSLSWEWTQEGGDVDIGAVGTRASAVAVDPGGDVVACGAALNDAGETEAWIRRFAADGTEEWSDVLTGLAPEAECAAIAADIDGALFVAGWDGPHGRPEDRQIWVARYGAAGARSWARSHEVLGEARAIAVAGGSGVFVAGWTRAARNADSDAWVSKYDFDGTEIWARTSDGPAGADDAAHAIAVDVEGGVVVAGEETTERGPGPNIWVRRYGP
jgi:uncharacterized delta-60 repeat protein